MIYRPPLIMRAGSAEDFAPPLSPGSYGQSKHEKIIVAQSVRSSPMQVDETYEEKKEEDFGGFFSPTCTLFGSCFMIDTTDREDVEVVLGEGGRRTDNPAGGDEKSQRSLSPLPFLRNESETTTSFFETLLQLPIAPCGPQDVE
jgi:hypothetical protein